jgi:hypothetical protein
VENTKRAVQAHFPLGEFVRANTKEVGTDPTFRVFNERFQQYLGEKKIRNLNKGPCHSPKTIILKQFGFSHLIFVLFNFDACFIIPAWQQAVHQALLLQKAKLRQEVLGGQKDHGGKSQQETHLSNKVQNSVSRHANSDLFKN